MFDIASVMREFPNIKLSYETLLHKKVYQFDFMMAIPEGAPYFAWFTTYKNDNVCYLLEIEAGKSNRILSIKMANACFSDSLCYGTGTILYGTLFLNNNTRVFTIQDMFYYKGDPIQTLREKMRNYENLFKTDIKQIVYNKKFVLFGLPLMSKNIGSLVKNIEMLPYSVKYIQYRYLNKPDIYNAKYVKPNNHNHNHNHNCHGLKNAPQNRELVFKVKAELQNDVYNLYLYSKDAGTSDYFYDIANIPDYKTSVMMNRLFRRIKENDNLDALEESDGEEEFEDERADKFVFLDKYYYMVCAYNNKFRKWTPLRLADKSEKLAELNLVNMK
jgi:hypothetical protein